MSSANSVEEVLPDITSGMAGNDDMEERSLRDLGTGKGDMCETVCTHCRHILSMRWAALCRVQCKLGGRAYDACLTVWSVRADLGIPDMQGKDTLW